MRSGLLFCFFVCLGSAANLRSQSVALIAEPSRSVRDTRGGGGQAFRINSSILKQTRKINVVLPASFSQTGPNRRYPVAIVFDGEANMPTVAAVSDELSRNGLIPEIIFVGIENIDPTSGRVYDLTPPGLSVSGSDLKQGGDRFLDFIERELLPAVDRQLRGAAPRLMIGHSSGGILATYAAATRPAFRGIIAIDGPVTFQDNWLVKKMIARAKALPAPPVRYVTYGAKFPWPQKVWNELVAAAPATWMLHRENMRLEGHETLLMITMYQGLREIFSNYSRLTAQQKRSTEMLGHYVAVSESFGAPMVPPRQLIRDAMDDLISEGRGPAARAALDALVAGYGAPSDSADLAGEIAEVERAPAPTETVEQLLKTPFPSPAQVKPFLGEWVGSIWVKADQPRTNNITLRIRVENGRVVAETKNKDAPPEMSGWKPVDYLSVTAKGLTYGRLNGMRPRGVMLWEGVLKGDTLAGKGRWGGVVVNDPFDPAFSFVRVPE
jgi:hypothetical protein